MTLLEIYNYALAQIPHDKRLETVDEDCIEGDRCRMMWDSVRTKILSVYNWSFARRSVECEAAVEEGRSGLLRWCYPAPIDALKVIGCFNKFGMQVESIAYNGMICTKEYPFTTIQYTVDFADIEQIPLMVQVAMAYELAFMICPLITGATAGTRRLSEMAARALADARNADAEAVQGGGEHPDSYIHARI